MKYREWIQKDMAWLAKQQRTVFIGEGVINAGRCYGTLNDVPLGRCVEMPIAENLIVGTAIGLALVGLRPIVIFQRMDFMLVAADAIINHLTKLPAMSGYQFHLPVILRTIVGTRTEKFCVGEQHCQDFRSIFENQIISLDYKPGMYRDTFTLMSGPVMVVEEKDKYETNIPALPL